MGSSRWRTTSSVVVLVLFVISTSQDGLGAAAGAAFGLGLAVVALLEFRRRSELEQRIWVDSSAVSFWLTVSGILAYDSAASYLNLPEPDLFLVAAAGIVLRGVVQLGMKVAHSD